MRIKVVRKCLALSRLLVSVSEEAVMRRMVVVTAPSLRLEGPARRPTGRRTGWAGQRGKALVRAHYLVLVATLLIWGHGYSLRADEYKKLHREPSVVCLLTCVLKAGHLPQASHFGTCFRQRS